MNSPVAKKVVHNDILFVNNCNQSEGLAWYNNSVCKKRIIKFAEDQIGENWFEENHQELSDLSVPPDCEIHQCSDGQHQSIF